MPWHIFSAMKAAGKIFDSQALQSNGVRLCLHIKHVTPVNRFSRHDDLWIAVLRFGLLPMRGSGTAIVA
jgi:hypothetical protein